MKHFEQMFLLEEARYLWDQSLAAEEDGDVFVPSETFVELSNHAFAKARIVRPEPGQEPVLALIIRGLDDAAAVVAANGFYEKGFELSFKIRDKEWGFVSKHVPPRLRPPVQDPGGNP